MRTYVMLCLGSVVEGGRGEEDRRDWYITRESTYHNADTGPDYPPHQIQTNSRTTNHRIASAFCGGLGQVYNISLNR